VAAGWPASSRQSSRPCRSTSSPPRPYHTFSISNRSDVETAALLLVVGVAVSELAAWGRHRQAEAVRRAVSIAGIGDAVSAMSADDLGAPRVEFACAQLVRLLDLTAAAYISRPPERGTVHLRSDGQVEVEGTFCDVEHYGLPVGRDIELDVVDGLGRPGRFVLRAGPALSPLPGATPGRRGRGALGGRGAGAPLNLGVPWQSSTAPGAARQRRCSSCAPAHRLRRCSRALSPNCRSPPPSLPSSCPG